jgi:hypothetical protein
MLEAMDRENLRRWKELQRRRDAGELLPNPEPKPDPRIRVMQDLMARRRDWSVEG